MSAMNGAEVKKAAVHNGKPAVNGSNGSSNGQKKRRKGQDLKPIITTEGQNSLDSSPASMKSNGKRYVS